MIRETEKTRASTLLAARRTETLTLVSSLTGHSPGFMQICGVAPHLVV